MSKFDLWDVVTITTDDEIVNGVIMDVFDGEEYRTDACGVVHKDVLQLAPPRECEAAYEQMANTLNKYYDSYADKKKIDIFFALLNRKYPNNKKLKSSRAGTEGRGFVFDF